MFINHIDTDKLVDNSRLLPHAHHIGNSWEASWLNKLKSTSLSAMQVHTNTSKL